ncbi:GNAT family N-acetyltransferase [Blastochloris viridis]|uniref:Putative ribosomal N-acetyltransferase YdaF n=1 Tax=Blastochloris viridis TaxID=1079 RepID=A0A0P0J870_BLAVI|nr:GNAT family N-acetyltransferase [Blastochloris viridis]ALK07885.1 Putative ribosomal N-acetyltransferase YdaF [Blastochloris viridis]CUU43807.1 Putative ribosomal N-acetyltransferase YdaF [Blastochloris viridis]
MTLEKSCEIRLPGEICLPVLETERLVLRTPRLEDAAAIAALADDPAIAINTALIPNPYRKQDAEAWIAQVATLDDDGATFGLYLKGRDIFIGACGLNRLDGVFHLGYWLGAPYRDGGLATEAARAVIDFAFARLKQPEITSAARVTNAASRRVLEKCGFQWTGVGLTRVKALAASVPVDRFRLDRKTWASLRAWGAVPLADGPSMRMA